ncbi:hypothetical protein I317_03334 [Kwoniella heveanensis CBS 569]|uniref:Uncharacterized protein n=1 Tax=Kwoniella heveanensis BCC8398 TaxID=1296120 RepID=A0A1B9GLJ1_9TREE|nr:hypothetical protein I316_06429 [Kwoniella heveanensis BCC8398]OCF42857.1 hypothetical protein I317_03334 [Kwoniella heveanensis CBS 569]
MGGDIPPGPWAVPFSVAAMALHKPSLPQKLQPVNPPIGVYPEFAGENGATLILQERPFDFDGEDYIVRTTDGIDVLRCKNAGGSKGKKVITDPNGVPLITVKNKMLAISKSFIGEDPDGKEVLKVKKKFALGNAAEAVYLNTPTGTHSTVDLKGDFWVGAADLIVRSGPIIAQLSRRTGSLTGKGLKDGRETYLVSVAPGVDLALITAICICFEEAKDS